MKKDNDFASSLECSKYCYIVVSLIIGWKYFIFNDISWLKSMRFKQISASQVDGNQVVHLQSPPFRKAQFL